MLHRPILSDRIGKWAYALIEYDLSYEPLKAMKGQIVTDFIVEHQIDDRHIVDLDLVSLVPWKLYFYGSVCSAKVLVLFIFLHMVLFLKPHVG
jgi:hypothetical protein